MSKFSATQLLAMALCHHQAGRVAEAEGIYRKILAQTPDDAAALDSLGVLALQTGRLAVAEKMLRRAVTVAPENEKCLCNLGECLRRLGRLDESADAFRKALALKSDLYVAWNNLGLVLVEDDKLEEAIAAFRRVLEINPEYAEAHSNLSNALKDAGALEEAILEGKRAVELKPDTAANHLNLGVALAAAGRADEAIAAYCKAILLQNNYGDAYSNLGNALLVQGKQAEAIAALRKAIELEPEAVQSHWNYAVMLLRSGDFARGWREYEWRWAPRQFPRPRPRFQPPRFPTPNWHGGPLDGQTILLHSEQGFGDTIQFCRYAPLVAARLSSTLRLRPEGSSPKSDRVARVILECPPELTRLFRSMRNIDRIIPRGYALPPFEANCPLMSLPLAFGTELQTIPADVPYLFAEKPLAADWAHRLGPRAGRPRIGICWAGNPTHLDDRNRSIPLSQWLPLAQSNAAFHSLQKGEAISQAHALRDPWPITIHAAALEDFADTAALIENLDLVICVDTSIAHLAGALGKPVWVLLPALADWRWLTDRTDSPWYPTMRLFRQEIAGEWAPVIARVAQALDSSSLDWCAARQPDAPARREETQGEGM